MTQRTWWVGRNKAVLHRYVFSRRRLGRTAYGDGDITFGGLRSGELEASLWHDLTGLRLKPGAGPVKLTLELKVRRVR